MSVKSCVQTMEGHTNNLNVSFAVFHPNLPIIVSGSEDGMEQRHLSSHRKHARLCVRTCMVGCTPQRRQWSSSRFRWRLLSSFRSVFSFTFYKVILPNLFVQNLARQRQTNIQHGPIWKTNLYPQLRHPLHPPRLQTAAVSLLAKEIGPNICHILTSLAQRPTRHCTDSSRRRWIHHLHFSSLAKQKFWKRCLIRLGTWLKYICCFGEYKNVRERPRIGMKGSGS